MPSDGEEEDEEEAEHAEERALKKARVDDAPAAPMLLTPAMMAERVVVFNKVVSTRPWLESSDRACGEYKRSLTVHSL
jgi:hypothetical protein